MTYNFTFPLYPFVSTSSGIIVCWIIKTLGAHTYTNTDGKFY